MNGDKTAYIDKVVSDMLPAIAAEGLADAVDGFCEGIAFSPAEIARVFDAARNLGLPVKLHADIYGKGMIYNGVVEGFSGGSGAAFAAIPAQNATGNWIKVVQRLPVRIRLDPAELREHPLRVGLSMTAEIDTRTVKQ